MFFAYLIQVIGAVESFLEKKTLFPFLKTFLCILSPWRCHFENSAFLRFPEELLLTTTNIRTCKSLHLTKINSALIHFSGLQKWLQSKNLILRKTFLKTRFKKIQKYVKYQNQEFASSDVKNIFLVRTYLTI